MNWETIKSNCVRTACSKLRNNSDISLITLACLKTAEIPKGSRTIRQKLTKELEDKIVNVISSWDIRNYNHLKTLFPQHFPKAIAGVELTDKGWILIN
jgi:hypothetical protein